MNVDNARYEVRTVFMNGSVGQGVSGAVWLVSAAAGTFASPRAGILILVFGGMVIFPVTQAILWLSGRRHRLRKANPLAGLAKQVAFTVPVSIPLAGAAALHDLTWFYPAMMIIVGAHYMPFVFLYGMPSFWVLAAALVAGGFAFPFLLSGSFAAGGWFTAGVLLAFAAWAGVGKGA